MQTMKLNENSAISTGYLVEKKTVRIFIETGYIQI